MIFLPMVKFNLLYILSITILWLDGLFAVRVAFVVSDLERINCEDYSHGDEDNGNAYW